MFIFDVVDSLKRNGVKFAIAGGYAVALHGAVRATVDIDIVVALTKKNFIAVQRALGEVGLVSRLPVNAQQVYLFREDYVQNRKLIAWGFHHPEDPTKLVDVLLIHPLKASQIVDIRASDHTLPVLKAAPLMQLKRNAGRRQDLEDVRALEALGKR